MIGTLANTVRERRLRETAYDSLHVAEGGERVDVSLDQIAAEAAENFAAEVQLIVDQIQKKESDREG